MSKYNVSQNTDSDTRNLKRIVGDTSMPDNTLKQKLAAIEHERWADWMEYMFDCGIKSGDDNIGIRTCGWPTEQFNHWMRQIETDYEELSKKEQASDMAQVDRYWPLIEQYVQDAVNEARINQIKRVLPKYRHDHFHLVKTLEADLAELKKQDSHG